MKIIDGKLHYITFINNQNYKQYLQIMAQLCTKQGFSGKWSIHSCKCKWGKVRLKFKTAKI